LGGFPFFFPSKSFVSKFIDVKKTALIPNDKKIAVQKKATELACKLCGFLKILEVEEG